MQLASKLIIFHMQHNHFYKGTAYIWRATLEDMNIITVSSASHVHKQV